MGFFAQEGLACFPAAKNAHLLNFCAYFQDLESEIESVECKCGVQVNTGKCSQPFPKDAACIVYDDEVKL